MFGMLCHLPAPTAAAVLPCSNCAALSDWLTAALPLHPGLQVVCHLRASGAWQGAVHRTPPREQAAQQQQQQLGSGDRLSTEEVEALEGQIVYELGGSGGGSPVPLTAGVLAKRSLDDEVGAAEPGGALAGGAAGTGGGFSTGGLQQLAAKLRNGSLTPQRAALAPAGGSGRYSSYEDSVESKQSGPPGSAAGGFGRGAAGGYGEAGGGSSGRGRVPPLHLSRVSVADLLHASGELPGGAGGTPAHQLQHVSKQAAASISRLAQSMHSGGMGAVTPGDIRAALSGGGLALQAVLTVGGMLAVLYCMRMRRQGYTCRPAPPAAAAAGASGGAPPSALPDGAADTSGASRGYGAAGVAQNLAAAGLFATPQVSLRGVAAEGDYPNLGSPAGYPTGGRGNGTAAAAFNAALAAEVRQPLQQQELSLLPGPEQLQGADAAAGCASAAAAAGAEPPPAAAAVGELSAAFEFCLPFCTAAAAAAATPCLALVGRPPVGGMDAESGQPHAAAASPDAMGGWEPAAALHDAFAAAAPDAAAVPACCPSMALLAPELPPPAADGSELVGSAATLAAVLPAGLPAEGWGSRTASPPGSQQPSPRGGAAQLCSDAGSVCLQAATPAAAVLAQLGSLFINEKTGQIMQR